MCWRLWPVIGASLFLFFNFVSYLCSIRIGEASVPFDALLRTGHVHGFFPILDEQDGSAVGHMEASLELRDSRMNAQLAALLAASASEQRETASYGEAVAPGPHTAISFAPSPSRGPTPAFVRSPLRAHSGGAWGQPPDRTAVGSTFSFAAGAPSRAVVEDQSQMSSNVAATAAAASVGSAPVMVSKAADESERPESSLSAVRARIFFAFRIR